MTFEEDALRAYLQAVETKLRTGIASEHSYRSYLETLLDALGGGTQAVNEPKRVAVGAPDYVIIKGAGVNTRTVGHVECKDVGVSLDDTINTDQLRRYLRGLPNLVLTDYLEFRWYVDGVLHATARLATHDTHGKLTFNANSLRATADLLRAFLGHRPAPITSPKDLAERMARLAHIIRDLTVAAMQAGAASDTLKDLFAAFKEVLIPDLDTPEFADMFAQTLAYGLFAARYNHTGAQPFRRQDAAAEIPRTNPFLRKLFATIAGPDLADEPFIGFVDDLADLLADADMSRVLENFGRHTRQEDPIVHFYETFLQAYDPKLREVRGVYYTPEPVVSYIVRSVDALLRSEFGCADGLADSSTTTYARKNEDGTTEQVTTPRVLVLDPATGTATFLYMMIARIREQFMARGDAGMWSGYVQKHLLPRIFGFELLMAPYAMAHLKLGMQLAGLDLPEAQRKQWAYDFAGNERLGVYLTNSLEEAAKRSERLKLGGYISDEANEAATVKRDYPVMVVMGNPPYSGHSANKGPWINGLLRGKDTLTGQTTGNYFEVDGQPLGERNPKWLNDDYVKFIRFAQWRIERTGHGVLAFITNHGYLDNPTFRGMRQSLMRTFDDIYVLDLHGNSKKKERAPGGGKDENVFDIQQGVAIGVFIKRANPTPSTKRDARVYHADLWGERAGKYAWLSEHDAATTEWTPVEPRAPFYFFVPQNTDLLAEYEQGYPLPKAMSVNVLGFQTHRDHFAIDMDESNLRNRMQEMLDVRISDSEYADKYELTDNRDWQLARARQDLRKNGGWPSLIKPCQYRPFDRRACLFDEIAMDYPRTELRQHMLQPNLSVNVTRQTKADGWQHAVVADAPTPALYVEIKDGCNAFPLYLYPDSAKPGLWGDAEPSTAPGNRRPNLAPAFVADFAGRLGMAWLPDGKGDRQATFGPEDVFSYIYAVLHSPTYRERYVEFLRSDFPRVPLTGDSALFRALCALGDQLVSLHLLSTRIPAITRYPIKGGNLVEQVRYTEPTGDTPGRVWINKEQYFEGVPREVWEFHIGGYQVCEKWLKDRKGRTLTYDDLDHYQQTVAALADTRRLMDAIDEAIEEHGGWPLG